MKNIKLKTSDFQIKKATVLDNEFYCIEFSYLDAKLYVDLAKYLSTGKISGIQNHQPDFRKKCLASLIDVRMVLEAIKKSAREDDGNEKSPLEETENKISEEYFNTQLNDLIQKVYQPVQRYSSASSYCVGNKYQSSVDKSVLKSSSSSYKVEPTFPEVVTNKIFDFIASTKHKIIDTKKSVTKWLDDDKMVPEEKTKKQG
jgi:hypothetical protein